MEEQFAHEKGYFADLETLKKNSIFKRNFENWLKEKEATQPKTFKVSLEEDISKQGYKADSPYKDQPQLIINSNSGKITMDNVLIPLSIESNLGEKKVLQPNSGVHQFNGTYFKETPL
jgi:hypothetical protein